MKAKTITELVAEHRDVLQMLQHQIEEQNLRINEADKEIQRLRAIIHEVGASGIVGKAIVDAAIEKVHNGQ